MPDSKPTGGAAKGGIGPGIVFGLALLAITLAGLLSTFERPALAQNYFGGNQVWSAFAPTGQAPLAVTTATGRVALGSAAQVAWVCNTGATNVAYVALGSVTVVATVAAGFPVLPAQCSALNAAGYTHIAAITAASTTALVIATGSGRP